MAAIPMSRQECDAWERTMAAYNLALRKSRQWQERSQHGTIHRRRVCRWWRDEYEAVLDRLYPKLRPYLDHSYTMLPESQRV